MRGQIEARIPIVYSCSPRAVGSGPCPMVVRDHCRNFSDRLIPPYSALFDRLIPPYSVHPQASALRPKTTRLLDRARENQSCQVFSNEADRPAKYGRQQMN